MTTATQSIDQQLSQIEKVNSLMSKSGLDWEVAKCDNYTTLPSGVIVPSESRSIRRLDTNAELGVLGSGYEVLQNREMAEMLVEAGGSVDLTFSRGGEQNGGRRVFMQAILPTAHIGRSDLKRNITALNSHDGSCSVALGSTNQVVICSNTFYKAYKELSKVRHTSTMMERVKVLIASLRMAIENDEKLVSNFTELSNIELNEDIVARVIKGIFKVDKDTPTDKISTRKTNQIKDFAESIEKSIVQQGETVWALFNGVTHYTNHVAGAAKKDDGGSFLMTGAGATTNEIGYNEIMKWVSKNTEANVYEFA